jgi:hypothetical protein
LKEFGAFTAKVGGSAATAVQAGEAPLNDLLETLLLRAEIRVRGESREAHFNTSRISACTIGARGRLYPGIDDPAVATTFLFGEDGRMVALPVSRRSPLAERREYWSDDEPVLTPLAYLLEAVNGLPATADAGNVPVSEEEANRLAWLGVELQPMNQELARANGVAAATRDGETGGLVTHVYPGSPAETAGIRVGSVLLRLLVPGQPLPIEVEIEEDPASRMAFPWDRLDQLPEQYFDRIPMPWPRVETEFIRTVTDLGFGTPFTAEWVTEGQTKSGRFETVAGPAHYGAAPKFRSERLGTTVKGLTYEVRRYLQLGDTDPGVVVDRIEPGSRVSIAGVKPYELITHISEVREKADPKSDGRNLIVPPSSSVPKR